MSHSIAIIEDDPAILFMYKYKLELQGFIVQTATNGADGFKLCKLFKPSVILLDLNMPIMNGDEMLQKVRATEWGASMRVIILTNISKSEASMGLRFLNVDRYVVKAQYTPQQVVGVVTEVLELVD